MDQAWRWGTWLGIRWNDKKIMAEIAQFDSVDNAMSCALLADETEAAQQLLGQIRTSCAHHWCVPNEAQVIIVIGGDGFMLRAMHRFHHLPVKLYGLNTGRIGFLLNRVPDPLPPLLQQIARAEAMRLVPLKISVLDIHGTQHQTLAFNEVTLFRELRQAAHVSIMVDDVIRLDSFMGDGLMVATPAGSTAYNLSAGGPVLPLDANVLTLTAMAAFRPRRWPGALLSRHSHLRIIIREQEKRPVSFSADSQEIRDVAVIEVCEAPDQAATLLFDPEQSLSERIFAEQFYWE